MVDERVEFNDDADQDRKGNYMNKLGRFAVIVHNSLAENIIYILESDYPRSPESSPAKSAGRPSAPGSPSGSPVMNSSPNSSGFVSQTPPSFTSSPFSGFPPIPRMPGGVSLMNQPFPGIGGLPRLPNIPSMQPDKGMFLFQILLQFANYD